MTAAERAELTRQADDLCLAAFESVTGAKTGTTGIALVAVGGYGRGEMAPYSDLDVVLVYDDHIEIGDIGEKLWYPLWDSGRKLDHSVRSVGEMVAAASADIRVALGLLDVRHVAGDSNLAVRLRGEMLALWRRQARSRLPELRPLMQQRHQMQGELAHASVPDLKEAAGGLRDATILKAIVATWLVDVSHTDLEPRRQGLLDVRDHLHAITGRAGDRITPELWGPLAERLGLANEREAQQHVRRLGRRITHISRLTWRRVDGVLNRPRAAAARRPELQPLEGGVALSGGEIVLDKGADPKSDPLLFLRAAALAAENDVVLAPPTAARLAAETPPIPVPWPEPARHLLARLLAAGNGLLAVWETLDETGSLDRIIPEWERIRLLPHASEIHRFTVDRHVIETCLEASKLIRTVGRPDVLMVAALLHDIGKGGTVDHCIEGAPLARTIAERWGFDADSVDLIEALVRWHLLLATVATTRDPEDPATVAAVTDHLPSAEAIDLLAALSQADARAASPKAWSSWRAALIADLAARCRTALGAGSPIASTAGVDVPVPKAVKKGKVAFALELEDLGDGERMTVVAKDRVGLLADVAATLAVQRLKVRAARVWSEGEIAFSVWDLEDQGMNPAVLRSQLEAVAEGRIDLAARLRLNGAKLAPRVTVRPEASAQSTVLEVRASDRPGTVYFVCAALARMGVSVRSAHVDTLGPQAVDVFYVQESDQQPLSSERSRQACEQVVSALTGESDPAAR